MTQTIEEVLKFQAIVRLMDSDICEQLNFRSLRGEIESNEEFLAEYRIAHRAKFGEDFSI